MAEALFDDAVDRSTRLGGRVKSKSAGTFACEDAEPTPNAVKVMKEMGLDIEKHRSRQIDAELVEWADLILTMESAHIEQIEAMFPEAESKLNTLIGYAEGVLGYPGLEGYDVEDPYGEDLDDYRCCAAQIKRYIEIIINVIKQEVA